MPLEKTDGERNSSQQQEKSLPWLKFDQQLPGFICLGLVFFFQKSFMLKIIIIKMFTVNFLA